MRKVAQDFLLTTGTQFPPRVRSALIFPECTPELRWHPMRRTTAIFLVELQLNRHSISHFGAGRFADIAVQVQIKTPVANWHEINAPRLFRLAIHADANGKRPAPAFANPRRALCADKHVGIDAVDLNCGAESQYRHETAITAQAPCPSRDSSPRRERQTCPPESQSPELCGLRCLHRRSSPGPSPYHGCLC